MSLRQREDDTDTCFRLVDTGWERELAGALRRSLEATRKPAQSETSGRAPK